MDLCCLWGSLVAPFPLFFGMYFWASFLHPFKTQCWQFWDHFWLKFRPFFELFEGTGPKVKIALPPRRELSFQASRRSPNVTFFKHIRRTAAGFTFYALLRNLGTLGDSVWASPNQLFWTHLLVLIGLRFELHVKAKKAP